MHKRTTPPGRSNSPGAIRARRARARRRAGYKMLHLLVNERRFAAALRARDQLERDRLEDVATTEDIETAASEVLSGFCDRWLGKEKPCA
jgi:hypothetical protein